MLTVTQKIQVIEEVNTGKLTQKEIAQKYCISQSVLKSWLKKYHQGRASALVSQTSKINGQKYKTNNLDPKDREIAKLRKQLKEKELEN